MRNVILYPGPTIGSQSALMLYSGVDESAIPLTELELGLMTSGEAAQHAAGDLAVREITVYDVPAVTSGQMQTAAEAMRLWPDLAPPGFPTLWSE